MKVAVVCGGPSVEAEVSRVSARAVAAALADAGFEVDTLELDEGLGTRLLAFAPEVVFPVCHGVVGEDGSLQGLLEVLGLSYVGSGVLASALAMDKTAAKVHFAAAGLPLAAGRAARSPAEALSLRSSLGPGLVVKPAAGGSALGVTRVLPEDPTEALERALAAALEQGPVALVEELVAGDEVTCGVLHGSEPVALPPTRIRAPFASFYDFESRYAPGKSVHECPPPYEPGLQAEIQRVAVEAHRALGCRDLSRADFVVDPVAKRITLLEVNTMPGFTPTSLYPEAAAAAGLDFVALCRTLVETARERGATRRLTGVAFPGAHSSHSSHPSQRP